MQLSCEHQKLSQAVEAVQHIVITKSTLPIIGNILLEAGGDKLKVSANNLEIGIEIGIPAKVKQPGSVLIPAKTLSGLVSKLPRGPIEIHEQGRGVIEFIFRKANLELRSLPADEFPVLARIKEQKTVSLDAALVAEMIGQTIFAVSASEEKYVLNGVLFELTRNSLSFVATDGFRLARREEELKEKLAWEASMIVPSRALAEVQRIIEHEPTGSVIVIAGDEQLAFRYGDAYIVSRLIHGQFPDYKQVIPKAGTTRVTLDRQEFLEAVERASVIAARGSNVIRFELENGNFHVLASVPEVGSVKETLDVKVKRGTEVQISFNARLVIEALKVLECQEVSLELSGALAPGLLRPEDGETYVYVAMPIRTAETVPA